MMIDKLMSAIDPNNESYTMEDFNIEFGVNNNLTISNNFKCINKSNNSNPSFATSEAAGFDLRAYTNETIILDPFKRILIKTGLFFEIPKGFEIQVRPRSGLALNNGITVLNSPGTIDSDYRGEVGVILINLGEEPFTINNGDRIAQAVISQVLGNSQLKLTMVEEINNNTERSFGGFGSTGLQ